MTCSKSHEMLIDYLYGDLTPPQKQETEAHVATCKKCERELAGLRETTAVLSLARDEPAGLNLTFVPAGNPSPAGQPRARVRWQRFGFGLALGLALVVMILSLSNFHARYVDGTFSLQFGAAADPAPHVKAASRALPEQPFASEEELSRYKQETTEEFERLLLASEARQKSENRLVLRTLLQDLDLQRKQDLELVERGLESYHLSNRVGLLRTNKVLDYLIQVANAQNNQLRAIQINGRAKE